MKLDDKKEETSFGIPRERRDEARQGTNDRIRRKCGPTSCSYSQLPPSKKKVP
jgi:hypothetical protein